MSTSPVSFSACSPDCTFSQAKDFWQARTGKISDSVERWVDQHSWAPPAVHFTAMMPINCVVYGVILPGSLLFLLSAKAWKVASSLFCRSVTPLSVTSDFGRFESLTHTSLSSHEEEDFKPSTPGSTASLFSLARELLALFEQQKPPLGNSALLPALHMQQNPRMDPPKIHPILGCIDLIATIGEFLTYGERFRALKGVSSFLNKEITINKYVQSQYSQLSRLNEAMEKSIKKKLSLPRLSVPSPKEGHPITKEQFLGDLDAYVGQLEAVITTSDGIDKEGLDALMVAVMVARDESNSDKIVIDYVFSCLWLMKVNKLAIKSIDALEIWQLSYLAKRVPNPFPEGTSHLFEERVRILCGENFMLMEDPVGWKECMKRLASSGQISRRWFDIFASGEEEMNNELLLHIAFCIGKLKPIGELKFYMNWLKKGNSSPFAEAFLLKGALSQKGSIEFIDEIIVLAEGLTERRAAKYLMIDLIKKISFEKIRVADLDKVRLWIDERKQTSCMDDIIENLIKGLAPQEVSLHCIDPLWLLTEKMAYLFLSLKVKRILLKRVALQEGSLDLMEPLYSLENTFERGLWKNVVTVELLDGIAWQKGSFKLLEQLWSLTDTVEDTELFSKDEVKTNLLIGIALQEGSLNLLDRILALAGKIGGADSVFRDRVVSALLKGVAAQEGSLKLMRRLWSLANTLKSQSSRDSAKLALLKRIPQRLESCADEAVKSFVMNKLKESILVEEGIWYTAPFSSIRKEKEAAYLLDYLTCRQLSKSELLDLCTTEFERRYDALASCAALNVNMLTEKLIELLKMCRHTDAAEEIVRKVFPYESFSVSVIAGVRKQIADCSDLTEEVKKSVLELMS